MAQQFHIIPTRGACILVEADSEAEARQAVAEAYPEVKIAAIATGLTLTADAPVTYREGTLLPRPKAPVGILRTWHESGIGSAYGRHFGEVD